MIHLTPLQATLLVFGAPLAVAAVCHALVHLFVALKMPRAALFVATRTLTITALLPAAIHQLMAPSIVTLASDLDAAAKERPDDASLTRWAAMAKRLAGGVLVTTLAVLGAACNGVSGESVLKSSIDVRNQIAGVEVLAARELHTRCTAPMETIAKETEPQRGFDAKELALQCDPLVEAYDSERRSRMSFDQATGQVSTGKVTVGDMLVMLQTLIANASALEKEIAQ